MKITVIKNQPHICPDSYTLIKTGVTTTSAPLRSRLITSNLGSGVKFEILEFSVHVYNVCAKVLIHVRQDMNSEKVLVGEIV